MKYNYLSHILRIKNSVNKKRFLILLFLLLNIPCFLRAQRVQWAKSMGSSGGGSDVGQSTSIDVFGNVYTLGIFSGTVDFDPGPGVYNLTGIGTFYDDIFISKFDNNGNFIWAKRVGGTDLSYPDQAGSLELDSDGNIYITGSFGGTGDFDPGVGTFDLTSNGNEDIFILKLNSNGNFVWAKAIGSTGIDVGLSITVDFLGNVYTTGEFQATVDFDPGAGNFSVSSFNNYDCYILKLDSLGNFIWVKTFGGSNAEVSRDILTDVGGNVYITGAFNSLNVDFDPGLGVYNLSTTVNGSDDVFIIKLDSTGNFIWARKMGGSLSDIGYSVAVDLNQNVMITGLYKSTADFDPGAGIYNLTSAGGRDVFITKLDINGGVIWAKSIGATADDVGMAIAVAATGNIFITGYFQGTADFDPGIGMYNKTSVGGMDIFISQLDSNGNFIAAQTMGGIGTDRSNSVALDVKGNIYITGDFLGTADFDHNGGIANLTSLGNSEDIFIAKYVQKGIRGAEFNDYSQNCIQENGESGLEGRMGIISPGEIVVETNNVGVWFIDSLPVGNYSITFDASGPWVTSCPTTMNFVVNSNDSITNAPNFGFVYAYPCAEPSISITAPFLRRCFSNQVIYVQACNQSVATGALNAAYVDVELDPLLAPTSASLPYSGLGNNQYRFQVDTLNPGQCINFTINTNVSCAANLQQTLCMEARLYPADSCVFDTVPTPSLPVGPGTVAPCTLPWDHSSLSVDGYCANDTVYFTVTNNGSAVNGNMQCYTPVRVYVDGVLTDVDSVLLSGGQTITYSYPGNGQTWVLQADQHPLHPGNSHPTAHVEACGDSTNWTPGLVNDLPLDDADPIVDMYCGVVSGSYDPNDKTGFPTGLGTQHDILPNQQLQYMIRFQNTGTDTAFTIVVRDTLDTDLNIFSVVPGTASHNYTFRMYGPRVLEWTFNNIMLPDSNVNEVLSHGFATFRVDQQPNLPNGTKILNDADIYFDFNAPVITNQTLHTINNQLHNYAVGIKSEIKKSVSQIKVYPNPASNNVTIVLAKENVGSTYTVTNQLGQSVLQGKLNAEQNLIDINNLTNGFYIVTVEGKAIKQSVKLVKQ